MTVDNKYSATRESRIQYFRQTNPPNPSSGIVTSMVAIKEPSREIATRATYSCNHRSTSTKHYPKIQRSNSPSTRIMIALYVVMQKYRITCLKLIMIAIKQILRLSLSKYITDIVFHEVQIRYLTLQKHKLHGNTSMVV